MDPIMILLRLVHIVLGVFWAGTLFFVATFLIPSVQAAGPEGARVMQALVARRYLDLMPLIALLTIVSGAVLYWRVSGGLQSAWIRSPVGLGLTMGAVAALVAFAIGVSVMRPATVRAGKLAAAAQQLPEGPARGAQLAQVQVLRQRAAAAARWVAALLLVAVAGMAVGRYL